MDIPADGRSVPWSESDHSSDDDQNHENEEPKKLKAGDRVRVNNSEKDVSLYLQDDNRLGTIVNVDSNGYWLHMDEPVLCDGSVDDPNRSSIVPEVPEGYAFFAWPSELEPTEPREFRMGDKVRIKAESVSSLGSAERQRIVEELKDMTGYIVGMTINYGNPTSIIVGYSPHSGPGGYKFIPQDLELIDPIKEKHRKKMEEAVNRAVKIEEEAAVDKAELKALKIKLKTLIQTALELIQDIEKTFKDSEEYPIFGMNLAKQEPVEKNQSSRLNDCLSSLGVVLYHLYIGQSEHNNHSYLLDGYSKPEDMPEAFWKVVNKLLGSEYKDLNELKEDLKQTNMDSP